VSEHGWPGDFHDEGPHDDGLHHDDGVQHEDLAPHEVDDGYFDDVHQHDGDVLAEHAGESHDSAPWVHSHDGAHEHEHDTSWPQHMQHSDAGDQPHELSTVGADPDALPEPDAAEPLEVFPPVLDVGPLPEPVDGFPWIDPGSLGLADPASLHAIATAQVNPEDLAEYAATDLPPGVDPWAALADSDDPATSALARWWSENS